MILRNFCFIPRHNW